MPKYSKEETEFRDWILNKACELIRFKKNALEQFEIFQEKIEKGKAWNWETVMKDLYLFVRKETGAVFGGGWDGTNEQNLVDSIYSKNGYVKYEGKFITKENLEKIQLEKEAIEKAEADKITQKIKSTKDSENILEQIKKLVSD